MIRWLVTHGRYTPAHGNGNTGGSCRWVGRGEVAFACRGLLLALLTEFSLYGGGVVVGDGGVIVVVFFTVAR